MFSSLKNLFNKNQNANESFDSNDVQKLQPLGGSNKTRPMKSIANGNPIYDIAQKNSFFQLEDTTKKVEDIATIFSEGNNFQTYEIIKNHFKEQQGNVDKRIWFMLLDLFQILENKKEFEKTSFAFAQYFDTSPPSWFGTQKSEAVSTTVMTGGKNILMLSDTLPDDYETYFKEFLKSAIENNFCRINLSQYKFKEKPAEHLYSLLNLLEELRIKQTPTTLMGDNTLIDFLHDYIEEPSSLKDVHETFIDNEKLIWETYIELMQWKKEEESFENYAIFFADKFEISPPNWNPPITVNEEEVKVQEKKEEKKEEEVSFPKELNVNNVNLITEHLEKQFEQLDQVEIDFSNIDRIDFSSTGALSYYLQEFFVTNPNKQVTIKNSNEFIIVLLQMLGVNELTNVIPRKRT